MTHAIGDRANTEVLNVYDDLRAAAEARGLRLRIEHSQHLRPEDIARHRGLVCSVQPIHLQADAPMIRELMPHLADGSYAFKSLMEAGAILAFGSDAPVAAPIRGPASPQRSPGWTTAAGSWPRTRPCPPRTFCGRTRAAPRWRRAGMTRATSARCPRGLHAVGPAGGHARALVL